MSGAISPDFTPHTKPSTAPLVKAEETPPFKERHKKVKLMFTITFIDKPHFFFGSFSVDR